MGAHLKLAYKIKHVLHMYFSKNCRFWEGIVLYAELFHIQINMVTTVLTTVKSSIHVGTNSTYIAYGKIVSNTEIL
jgi:hypothetical protein